MIDGCEVYTNSNVACLLLQLAGENRTGEQVYQPPASSEDTTPPSKRSKFINTIV